MSRYSELQAPAAPMSEVTKEDFLEFRSLQMSGTINMAATSQVSDFTGLSIAKVKAIKEHYTALAKLFPDKD